MLAGDALQRGLGCKTIANEGWDRGSLPVRHFAGYLGEWVGGDRSSLEMFCGWRHSMMRKDWLSEIGNFAERLNS